MDRIKLSSSEKRLAITSGSLLVLSSIPAWATFPVGEALWSVYGDESVTAWDGSFSFLTTGLALLMTLAIFISLIAKAVGKFDDSKSAEAVALGYVAAAVVAVLGMLGAVVLGPGESTWALGVQGERGPLLFVGFALALFMAAMALRHLGEVSSKVSSSAAAHPKAT